MNVLKGALVFAAGVAVGVVVSWKFHEKKCNEIIDKEVESVKKAFKQTPKTEETEEVTTSPEELEDEDEEDDDDEYGRIVDRLGYSGSSKKKQPHAYVISPEQFGENEDYERASLTMYSDGIVAWDVDDKLILSPETVLGEGSLDKFGEYEDGVLHVRNDEMKMDFEISEDMRKYSEVCDPGDSVEDDE